MTDDTASPGYDPLLDFAPVPSLTKRHDGWTPERQRLFVQALQATGQVSAAARSAGMSVKSCYALRKRLGARAFSAAWDEALDEARGRAFDRALAHALQGVTVFRFHGGRFVYTSERTEGVPAMRALERAEAREARAKVKIS